MSGRTVPKHHVETMKTSQPAIYRLALCGGHLEQKLEKEKPRSAIEELSEASMLPVPRANGELTTQPATPSIHTLIQGVIDGNNRTEFLLMGGTAILFLLGASGVIVALASGQFIWTIPSAGISAFLYWPYLRIEKLRNRNIALASAAALISQLPPAAAAKEIQKLIEKLFREDA